MLCDSVGRKSALIPMVSHALSRMQWALAGAKRLECGSLLPLCFHAQTRCLASYQQRSAADCVTVRPPQYSSQQFCQLPRSIPCPGTNHSANRSHNNPAHMTPCPGRNQTRAHAASARPRQVARIRTPCLANQWPLTWTTVWQSTGRLFRKFFSNCVIFAI